MVDKLEEKVKGTRLMDEEQPVQREREVSSGNQSQGSFNTH